MKILLIVANIIYPIHGILYIYINNYKYYFSSNGCIKLICGTNSSAGIKEEAGNI